MIVVVGWLIIDIICILVGLSIWGTGIFIALVTAIITLAMLLGNTPLVMLPLLFGILSLGWAFGLCMVLVILNSIIFVGLANTE